MIMFWHYPGFGVTVKCVGCIETKYILNSNMARTWKSGNIVTEVKLSIFSQLNLHTHVALTAFTLDV